MLCSCPAGQDQERRLDAMQAARARGDEVLWKLTKSGSVARAVTHPTDPGFGIELRFIVNGVLLKPHIYHDVEDLLAAASAKRDELRAAGWVDARPVPSDPV
jgi:hypothetical protein